MDLTGDEKTLRMIMRYKELGDASKDMDKERRAIKAELLTVLGDAEKAGAEGFFKISAGMIGPSVIETYERKGYRNFRVTVSK